MARNPAGGARAVIVLTLRTDKPEAEIGLYEGQEQLAYQIWTAHRQLAETIHHKIDEILNKSSKSIADIGGIACYKGPGSFTGLRIGLSVANALAYSLGIPIVGATGDDWAKQAIKRLLSGNKGKIVVPEYGASPRTTSSAN